VTSDRGDRGSTDDDADSLLRAVADAPERIPEVVPERLGHFRIVGKLGQGGMGIVYRAHDERLRRTVALKVLPLAFARDEERRRRFLREARSAAALTHANIATVHDVAEDGGRIFIVMEIVEGEGLRDRVARGPVPPREAMRIARGIARGLARAHAAGVVHRDLKPDNVRLDAEGEPKILDFGLATLRETGAPLGKTALGTAETESVGTMEGRILGTPQYMSPEQARGDAVDARSDLFSLGAVIYEMCAGRRPFAGTSSAEVLAAILRDEPSPLRELAPEVPAELAAVVERSMAKSPVDRFRDARELLDALEAIPADASAGSATAVERSGGHPRVGRLAALSIGTVAVAVAIFFFVARERAWPQRASSAPAAGAAFPGRVRAITDWPPPKTSSHEAATLYAEGLQALRDASLVLFRSDLLRAVALDGHFAAARLRLAINSEIPEEAQRHLAAATQSRASLDERDLRLLSFADAVMRNPSQREKRYGAARELARDLPDDSEALFWAAAALKWSDAQDEARALLERAVRVDPKFAGAEFSITEIADLQGDLDGVLAASDRCLAIQPRAATCIAYESFVYEARGQCREVERQGRDIIAIDPLDWTGYEARLSALAAGGAPIDALADVAAKEAAGMAEPAKAKRVTDMNAANVALLAGDFASAEASLLAMQQAQADLADDRSHTAEGQLIALYDEEADGEKAAAVADAYLRKLPGYSRELVGPSRGPALWAARRAGRLSAMAAASKRDEWLEEARKPLAAWDVGGLWLSLFARGVETSEEAHEALAALPAFSPLPGGARWPEPRGELGIVHALAGNAEEAAGELRVATAWCGSWIDARYYHGTGRLFASMRARRLLGSILEQKGDRDGACSTYAAILSRWGSARTRSVTADAARARSKALGCR
jgi:serine/threonine-protein kinase